MSHQNQDDNLIAENTAGSAEHVSEAVPVSANENAESQLEHEVTLYAEPIFHLGSFTVTNALLNTWLVVAFLVIFAVYFRKKIKKIPGILQSIIEILVEKALDLCDSVTHSRVKTQKIFPIVITLFVFIMINNWSGLIPGVGSIGFIETNSHAVFVPLFRGGTADFNTTLALALFAVVGSNIFGVVAVGAWKYINKFVNLKALAEIPRRVIKEPTILLVNPIKFFVGFVEIIGEIAKVASLSFRLFGNIFAGEVLLTSMAAMVAYLVPIPFIFLEIIVGLIQALIFSLLTLVYFSIASTAEEH